MQNVARGYSLRETVALAKLANWSDISDVALLKRLRNSEEWLRRLCIELLRENVACGCHRQPERVWPSNQTSGFRGLSGNWNDELSEEVRLWGEQLSF